MIQIFERAVQVGYHFFSIFGDGSYIKVWILLQLYWVWSSLPVTHLMPRPFSMWVITTLYAFILFINCYEFLGKIVEWEPIAFHTVWNSVLFFETGCSPRSKVWEEKIRMPAFPKCIWTKQNRPRFELDSVILLSAPITVTLPAHLINISEIIILKQLLLLRDISIIIVSCN